MSKPRPRLALVLPSSPAGVEAAAAALRELRAAPTVRVVAVGPADSIPGALPIDPERALDELARVDAAGALPLIAADEPLVRAQELLEAGRLDGLLLNAAPGTGPRLWIRDGVRVVEAFPGVPVAQVGKHLSDGLVEILASSERRLRALGVGSPKLALFDLDGHAALAEAAKTARAKGLDVLGPLSPTAAVAQRADALIALTPSQLELPLALQGTGPETALALDAPWAWPKHPQPRATVLALDRLARCVTASPGSLAEERELARKPSVSISKRPSAATKAPSDRCPFCHERLEDAPDGSGRAGPPVTCAECGTPHHRGCLAEHGACTVLGCRGISALRLGITIPVARLGGALAAEYPFQTLAGSGSVGPSHLRVEAPIDDPDAHPTRRRLGIEVASPRVGRGEILEGYVVVWAPRPFRVRGGSLRLRASLTTQNVRGHQAPKTEPILGCEAPFVGDGPAGALGRLQDGVVGLFSKTGVAIPAGVRRYPFSFQVARDHPATVRNRQGEIDESVTTTLEASLDAESAHIDLEVR